MYFVQAAKQRDLRNRRIAQNERQREQRRLEELTTTLTDNDIMAWGKYKGQKLGDVPMRYWRWFLAEDWCQEKPELFAYAQRKLGGVQ